ncbi:hypothetical protein V5799_022975 [Amblyomma americanum]|uniref:Mediator of DNA damage checkpoint protein 1 n=1 Tax=Amblyomma americanum TaxID=6943 RepID=A0AAQ4FJK1_AMBAM
MDHAEGDREVRAVLKVELEDTPSRLQTFSLKQGDNVVGRSYSCDIRIKNSLVSRQHALIKLSKSGIVIRDFGSRNKVMIGKKILKPRVTYGLNYNEEFFVAGLKAWVVQDKENSSQDANGGDSMFDCSGSFSAPELPSLDFESDEEHELSAPMQGFAGTKPVVTSTEGCQVVATLPYADSTDNAEAHCSLREEVIDVVSDEVDPLSAPTQGFRNDFFVALGVTNEENRLTAATQPYAHDATCPDFVAESDSENSNASRVTTKHLLSALDVSGSSLYEEGIISGSNTSSPVIGMVGRVSGKEPERWMASSEARNATAGAAGPSARRSSTLRSACLKVKSLLPRRKRRSRQSWTRENSLADDAVAESGLIDSCTEADSRAWTTSRHKRKAVAPLRDGKASSGKNVSKESCVEHQPEESEGYKRKRMRLCLSKQGPQVADIPAEIALESCNAEGDRTLPLTRRRSARLSQKHKAPVKETAVKEKVVEEVPTRRRKHKSLPGVIPMEPRRSSRFQQNVCASPRRIAQTLECRPKVLFTGIDCTNEQKEVPTRRRKHKSLPGVIPMEPRRSSRFQQNVCASPRRIAQTLECRPKVLFTGIDCTNEQKVVKELGGAVVTTASACTHLVTDKFRRTVKSLCCIGKGIPFIDVAWINKCQKARAFVDPTPYLLRDRKAERLHKFSLSKTLQKASECGGLLRGWHIHSTSHVQPSPPDMKEIVTCAGGKYKDYMPTRPAVSGTTVIVSCKDDTEACAHSKKRGVPIVSAEFLLSGLVQYKVDIDAHCLG